MSEPIVLHGYRYSVYTRIVRLALHHKGISCTSVESDPFSNPPTGTVQLHPFGRVPILSHGDFTLFETAAITRYIDREFPGASLQPATIRAQARMDQAISIMDNYGYWPMVRQVFEHRIFRPLERETPNERLIAKGLIASRKVLSVLNRFSDEGMVLTGKTITLADCHLIPMIDFFSRAAEGRDALSSCSALSHWWDRVSTLPMVTQTAPILPTP